MNLLPRSMTVRGHRIFFLSASRFQFVAIGPAKNLKIGQEIMSLSCLWQKINLNRVFAVAREIIYEHKFSVYTIFLTRLEHSYFNTCKIFLSFMMILIILVIMIENSHKFVSLFLHILWD